MENTSKSLDELLPLLFTKGRDMAGQGDTSPSMDVFHVRIEDNDVECKFFPTMIIHSPTTKAFESVVIGLPGKRIVIDYDQKKYTLPRITKRL